MHWTSIRNGELLRLAAGSFDVFLTVDRNLSFQQHVVLIPAAVVILRARTNRLADLQALVPELLHALQTARPGEVTVVGM